MNRRTVAQIAEIVGVILILAAPWLLSVRAGLTVLGMVLGAGMIAAAWAWDMRP